MELKNLALLMLFICILIMVADYTTVSLFKKVKLKSYIENRGRVSSVIISSAYFTYVSVYIQEIGFNQFMCIIILGFIQSRFKVDGEYRSF